MGGFQMKRIKKSWLPTFASILLFILIEFIDICGLIPAGQRPGFEILANSTMILFVVLGFWIELSPLESDDKSKSRPKNIFGNVLISVIAFPMNIDIFGHTIQYDRLLPDLWGWHLFWLICGITQVLVLSELGKNLLQQIRGFLAWIKEITLPLGNTVTGIANALSKSNKFVLSVLALGLALWTGFLYFRFHGSNPKEVLTDGQFYWDNLKIWSVYIMIGLLIHSFQPVAQSIQNGIQKAKPEIILRDIAIMIVVIVTLYLSPTVKSIVEIFTTIVISLSSFPLLIIVIKNISKSKKRTQPEQNTAPQDQEEAQQTLHTEIQEKTLKKPNNDINRSDLAFVLAVFIIPTIIILFLGVFTSSDSPLNTTPDLSQITTWLNFLESAANVAKSILDFLGLL